jgi:hypothetical protein
MEEKGRHFCWQQVSMVISVLLNLYTVTVYNRLAVVPIHFFTHCSSAAGGKLVEPTPEIERELATELEKVAKQYGGGEGVDMTQFPTFKFKGKYRRICVIDYRYHLE